MPGVLSNLLLVCCVGAFFAGLVLAAASMLGSARGAPIPGNPANAIPTYLGKVGTSEARATLE